MPLPDKNADPDLAVADLARWCHGNIVAAVRGRVGEFYLPGGANGSVYGATIFVQVSGRRIPLRCEQIGIGAFMPLQSGLLALAKNVADNFRGEGFGADRWPDMTVDVAVFTAVRRLGTLAKHDASSVNPAGEAVFVAYENNFAWTFDSTLSAARLIAETASRVSAPSPEQAEVHALRIQATRRPLYATTVAGQVVAATPAGGVMEFESRD